MALWQRDDPYRQQLVDARCKTADEVIKWIVDNSVRYGRRGPSKPSALSTNVYPEMAANAVLVLIAVACSLLNRQVARLARDFEQEGGFSEKLYKVRNMRRRSIK
jgi:four helix bundle suffix protein